MTKKNTIRGLADDIRNTRRKLDIGDIDFEKADRLARLFDAEASVVKTLVKLSEIRGFTGDEVADVGY